MKIRIEPAAAAGRCQIIRRALLLAVVCLLVFWSCGPGACPSQEVAEHIARQFIFPKYSGDMYHIQLETKRIFMKKIKDTEYCVFEFNYKVTLKSYFLRYENLERQSYKKEMQIAYIHTKHGWYGTVIQHPQ